MTRRSAGVPRSALRATATNTPSTTAANAGQHAKAIRTGSGGVKTTRTPPGRKASKMAAMPRPSTPRKGT